MSSSRISPWARWGRFLSSGGSVAPPNNPDITVNGDGWSSTWNTGTPPTFAPDTSPQRVFVTRAGFDPNTALAATYPDSIVLTERLRTPYVATIPNTQLSTNQVAQSAYLYTADTAMGVTNNSTEISPKPTAQWICGHRDFVTGTYKPAQGVTGGHIDARNGRQFACVKYTVTDGTTTVVRIVNTVTPVRRAYDKATIAAYLVPDDIWDELLVDTTDRQAELNVEVYPWFGVDNADYALSSVRKSVNDTALSTNKVRGLCTRYYQLCPLGVPIAYVNTAGTAAVGTAGWTLDPATTTTQATNTAFQYSTIRQAIDSLFNAANDGPRIGNTQAGIIRCRTGEYQLLGSGTARQGGVGMWQITRDPRDAKAGVIVTIGTFGTGGAWANNITVPASQPTRVAVGVKDITLRRYGTGGISTAGGAAMELFYEELEYDIQGFTTSLGAGTNQFRYFNGIRVYNALAGGALAGMTLATGAALTNSSVLLRGVEADMGFGSGGAPQGVESYNTHACNFVNCGSMQGTAFSEGENNMCVTGVTALNLRNGQGLSVGASSNVVGGYVSGCIFETADNPPADPALRLSADAGTFNLTHVIVESSAWLGAEGWGRQNIFYDDGATPRFYKFCLLRGVVASQPAIKADLDQLNGARVGNWQVVYAVGSRANYFYALGSFALQKNNGFAQLTFQYQGLNSFQNTDSANWINPGFTLYAAATRVAGSNFAGSGNGTYTTTVGSPLRGRVTERLWRTFDREGNVVTGTDDCGPYRA